MKKFIFILLSAILLLSCVKEENRIPMSDSKAVGQIGARTVRLTTIGNHEYLYVSGGYEFGICHYEDCAYCNKNKK